MIDHVPTPDLTLRWLSEADRAEFIRVHEVSREHFAPWMPAPADAMSLDSQFDEELARALDARESGSEVHMVAELPDGRIGGIFSLSQIFRRAFQNAYVGWRVSADQVGRGIGTAGVFALLDLAFAPEPVGLGLHRVQANIIPKNAASIRIAEKVGLRLEGRAVAYLKINGVWEDHLMFAKLADEHVPHFLVDGSA